MAIDQDRELDIAGCDFMFRALDDGGELAHYDALFWFCDPADAAVRYLVYADAAPDVHGEVGTFASIVADAAQMDEASERGVGCSPKKAPVIELRAIEGDAGWGLVSRALDQVDEQDDD